jgi:membrane protein implicated in regulation of membrane protease activity
MQDQYVSFSAAWFTLSLINAGLAQSKQRSGLNWWLASIFIGPLATLLIVAWPPGAPATEPRPGTMDRTQAIVIGAGIILFALLVFGLLSLGNSTP